MSRMSRTEIKEKIILYLNEQDSFSLPYSKLCDQFPAVGANFDVCVSRMDGIELHIDNTEPFIVTLVEAFRKRKRGV